MTQTPAEIAAKAKGLTAAQRRVLAKLAERGTSPYGHTCRGLGTSIAAPNVLWGKGLAVSSCVYGGSRSYNITPLGQLVAQHLKENGCG